MLEQVNRAAKNSRSLEDLTYIDALRQDINTFQHASQKAVFEKQIAMMATHSGQLQQRLESAEKSLTQNEKKIKNLEEKWQEEEQRKSQKKEERKRQEEHKASFDGMFSDSKQMTQAQMATLRGFLEQYRGQFKGWKLLYRASEKGFLAVNFHQKCDNRGPTVTIITNTINRTFGGFTKENWLHAAAYRNDPEAFVFSLDRNQKYLQKNTGYSMNANSAYGPTFGGGHDINI